MGIAAGSYRWALKSKCRRQEFQSGEVGWSSGLEEQAEVAGWTGGLDCLAGVTDQGGCLR